MFIKKYLSIYFNIIKNCNFFIIYIVGLWKSYVKYYECHMDIWMYVLYKKTLLLLYYVSLDKDFSRSNFNCEYYKSVFIQCPRVQEYMIYEGSYQHTNTPY